MVTFVLDASTVLRYLDGHAGGTRVADILKEGLAGQSRVSLSSIQWGEVAHLPYRRHGADERQTVLGNLLGSGVEVVAATPERAVRAGIIKAETNIPYADAFAVELAGDSPEHLLVTADFDAKPAEADVRIEFLPVNSRRL